MEAKKGVFLRREINPLGQGEAGMRQGDAELLLEMAGIPQGDGELRQGDNLPPQGDGVLPLEMSETAREDAGMPQENDPLPQKDPLRAGHGCATSARLKVEVLPRPA